MPYDLSYEYDAVGNRTRKVDNLSAGVTTYSYDVANQLQTSQDLSGTTTYTYDGAGNLKVIQAPASQTTTYTWDAWNRRTKVELPSAGGTVTSVYNSDGLRVLKEEPGGVVRKYLWDLQNYLVEYDGAGNVAVEYINKPERYGKLIAQKRAGEASPDYFHFDALGSTIALTNSSQSVTENYQYDAWGNRVSSNTYAPTLQYVGRLGYYFDSQIQDYYIRARTYSPRLGRFWSRDIVRHNVLTDWYKYALNGPTIAIDPSGLKCAKPEGVELIPNRGAFTIAKVQNYSDWKAFMKTLGIKVGPQRSGWVESIATFEWKPTSANFVDASGKCCCCKIGWVQIVKASVRRGFFAHNWLAQVFQATGGWVLDGGVPYATTQEESSRPGTPPVGNPCTLTTPIGMRDEPGWRTFDLEWATASFFTCVVCLKGEESARFETSAFGRKTLLGIGVYGCALWSHHFEWTEDGYEAKREIEVDIPIIQPFKKALTDYFYEPGAVDVLIGSP